jgi:hypothetical protein
MADSTRAVAAPLAPPPVPAPQPPDDDADDAVCVDLGRMAERDMPELVTRLLHGDPHGAEQLRSLHPATAQVIYETWRGLHRIVRRRRPVRKWEVLVFRFVGARCAHAGLDQDVVTSAISSTAEALMDVILSRSRQLDDLWGPHNVDAATAKFCGLLERYAARASLQVERGYEILANGVATPPKGWSVRLSGPSTGARPRRRRMRWATGRRVSWS